MVSVKSISGASGEYLVLGEMLRRGYECYLANGNTQESWDIVILSEFGKNIRIQVKTLDWPSVNAVNGKLDNGYDILIIVLLQKQNDYAKYVVASLEEVIPHLSNVNTDINTLRGKKGGKDRTLNLGKEFETHETKSALKVDKKAWLHLEKLVENLTQIKT